MGTKLECMLVSRFSKVNRVNAAKDLRTEMTGRRKFINANTYAPAED